MENFTQQSITSMVENYSSTNTIADAIIFKENETEISLSNFMADAINATFNYTKTTPNQADTNKAIYAVNKTFDSLNEKFGAGYVQDAIVTSHGADHLANLIGIAIVTAISNPLPYVGNIASFTQASTGATKAAIKYITPKALRDMGGLVAEDMLDGVNALKPYAIVARSEQMKTVGGTNDYLFNLKAKGTDTANTKMEQGRNSVMVAGVAFDDSNVDSTSATYVADKTVDGVAYKATFDYAAGTINVNIDKPVDGKTVMFTGALNRADLGKVVGQISIKEDTHFYVTLPAILDVSFNALDVRETSANIGVNFKANGFTAAIDKLINEMVGLQVQNLRGMAEPFGTTIDIAGNPKDTVAETYKPVIMLVDKARTEMVTESGQSGTICIQGGSGAEQLLSALSLDATDKGFAQMNNTMANLVRKIGAVRGNIAIVFDPTHDEAYPVVAGEHTLLLANVPSEDLKKVVLSGTGLPFIPEGDINLLSGNDNTRLSGTVIVSPNKVNKFSKQVKEIKVKM